MDLIKYVIFHGFTSCLVTYTSRFFTNFRVLFDKLAPRLYLVAHQCRKRQVDFRGLRLIHRHLAQDAPRRIHGRLPELLRIHLTKSFVTLDLVVLIPSDLIKDLL